MSGHHTPVVHFKVQLNRYHETELLFFVVTRHFRSLDVPVEEFLVTQLSSIIASLYKKHTGATSCRKVSIGYRSEYRAQSD